MDILSDQREFLEEHFMRLKLTGETITEKEFEKCTFEKCSLLQCNFVRCKFIDCTFQDSMLSAVTVLGCVFLETAFQDTKIMGIDWSRAEKMREMKFVHCDLQLCGFSFTNLTRLVLKNSVSKESNFMESDCTSADFEGTDFEKSTFHHTNLTDANFKNAFNYAIDSNNNSLKGATFSLPEAASLLVGLGIHIEQWPGNPDDHKEV